MFHCIWNWTWW